MLHYDKFDLKLYYIHVIRQWNWNLVNYKKCTIKVNYIFRISISLLTNL